MKTLLSLLCTILVVLAQGVSTAAAGSLLPAQDALCRCCGCRQQGCCAQAPAPVATPESGLPAPVPRHSEIQFLAVAVPCSLVPSVLASPFASGAYPDAPSVCAVPLFARDCAWLL